MNDTSVKKNKNKNANPPSLFQHSYALYCPACGWRNFRTTVEIINEHAAMTIKCLNCEVNWYIERVENNNNNNKK